MSACWAARIERREAAMTFSERFGRLLLGAFAWLVVLYLLLPLLVIVGTSFTTTAYLRFPPEGLTWAWYVKFLSDTSYLESIWLSAVLAVSATAIAIVLGVPVALALTREDVPGAQMVSALFLSPLVLPTIVAGAALLQFASALGFARTYLVLLVGHAVLVVPYIVRTTMASLAGFNASLEEAARDLGATGLQTFFLVTLPLIKPGLIAGALFAVIMSWINVELSMFNTTASLMPIPVKLFNYIQYNVDPMIAAVSATTIYVAVLVVVALDLVIGIDKVATTRN
jgi:putative spermidine/putrescine transport system permease protein